MVSDIASLIEIIINADDRASNQFQKVSTEVKKMAAIIGAITIATAGMTPTLLGGLGAITALFGTAGLAAAGFGGLAATTIMKTWEKAGDLEDAMLDVNAAMINNDAKGYAKAMAKVEAIWQDMTEAEKHVYTDFMTVKESLEAAKDNLVSFYRDAMQGAVDKHTSGGKVLGVTVKGISELEYKREAFKAHNKIKEMNRKRGN